MVQVCARSGRIASRDGNDKKGGAGHTIWVGEASHWLVRHLIFAGGRFAARSMVRQSVDRIERLARRREAELHENLLAKKCTSRARRFLDKIPCV